MMAPITLNMKDAHAKQAISFIIDQMDMSMSSMATFMATPVDAGGMAEEDLLLGILTDLGIFDGFGIITSILHFGHSKGWSYVESSISSEVEQAGHVSMLAMVLLLSTPARCRERGAPTHAHGRYWSTRRGTLSMHPMRGAPTAPSSSRNLQFLRDSSRSYADCFMLFADHAKAGIGQQAIYSGQL